MTFVASYPIPLNDRDKSSGQPHQRGLHSLSLAPTRREITPQTLLHDTLELNLTRLQCSNLVHELLNPLLVQPALDLVCFVGQLN